MGDSGQSAGAAAKTTHTKPQSILLAFVATCALWFAFVGTKATHELEVGLAASTLTVLFCAFVRSRSQSRISFHLVDLVQAWRIPWYILSGVWEITVVLFKDLLHLDQAKSLYRVCRFDPVSDDADHLGRRVLATAYTTAAPNFIIIGIDIDQRRMLFHQIEASDVPRMTQALGAHP